MSEMQDSLRLHMLRRSISIVLVIASVILAKLIATASALDCDPLPYQFAQHTFQELQKKYEKSIVLIDCGGALPEFKSVGTGFLIDSKAGLFLTARHVIIDDENHNFNCSGPESHVIAYLLGDMCEHTDLEYVDSDPTLDVALLRTHSLNHFTNRPYFELLTRGMDVNETEMEGFGFSDFFARLIKNDETSAARQELPGAAGGHACEGQPQPYRTNPLSIRNQRIQSHGANFIRESNAHEGDSGAPIFLLDGRVSGIVTEIGIGNVNAGTKVTPASAIVGWLVREFQTKQDLNANLYSLERWTLDNSIYDALNPDVCSPSSCLPSARIAAELQKIKAKSIKFEKFKPQQINRLGCPLYIAARTRAIDPQSSYLRDQLIALGVNVEASLNQGWTDHALAIVGSPKYTTYTKMAALELAEEQLAEGVNAAWTKDPNVVAEAICASGINSSDAQPIQAALNSYLGQFMTTAAASNERKGQVVSCPVNYQSPQLQKFKGLAATLSDVKLQQASLAKKSGTPTASPVSAVAIAAIANAGDKRGANALLDLADTLIDSDAELAASAYAKAFTAAPTARAITGFEDAINRSPDLRTKYNPAKNEQAIKNFNASFSSKIDSHSIAAVVETSEFSRGISLGLGGVR
jgi:hypothetical protein